MKRCYLASSQEEKSRRSGRGSRKTRLEGYGWVTRMLAAAAVRGKMGRHASSEHDPSVPRPEQTRKCERKLGKNEENPVREKRVNGGCARLIGPRTVTASSRGRVRVVRNPLNVMARLAEVVEENGTWLRSGAHG
ncbi:hypothetical protein CRG98_042441 [Punica granatum]|uniref:Uncharacterized protein n=1 Tax=Punica granatum TaxID=22663 RepID=A0A2I0HZM9_PUNGR|nr:hypothetical protein CRG98_042441 [Punica granatum]